MDYRIYVVHADSFSYEEYHDDMNSPMDYVKGLAHEVIVPEDLREDGDCRFVTSLLFLMIQRVNESDADQNLYFLVDETNGYLMAGI